MGITRIKEDTDTALLGRRLNSVPFSLATSPAPPPPHPDLPRFFSSTAMRRPRHVVTLSATKNLRGLFSLVIARALTSERPLLLEVSCDYAGTHLYLFLSAERRSTFKNRKKKTAIFSTLPVALADSHRRGTVTRSGTRLALKTTFVSSSSMTDCRTAPPLFASNGAKMRHNFLFFCFFSCEQPPWRGPLEQSAVRGMQIGTQVTLLLRRRMNIAFCDFSLPPPLFLCLFWMLFFC